MLNEIILSLAGVGLVAALVYAALFWLARGAAHDNIDALIAGNRYRYRRKMGKPDHEWLSEIGRRRWDEVTKAQERSREREAGRPAAVTPLRRRA